MRRPRRVRPSGEQVNRVNALLLVALLASCLWLVHVSYESRRLYAALDRAQGEARTLDTERDRLKSELRSQATPLRIERTAQERLGMRTATPAVTQYVPLGRAASAASASAASATSGVASGAAR